MKTRLTRRNFFGIAGTALGGAALGGAATPVTAAPAAPAAASGKPYRFSYALNAATIRGYKLGIVEQFELTAKAGYEAVEPWTSDLAKHVETGGSLKELGRRVADLGLKVVSAIGFPSWVVDDDQQRARGVEQLKREMDMLAQIGGTHIAAPPAGVNRPGNKLDLDKAAERYRAILEVGRQTGVIPQIEIWGSSANLGHLADAIYVAAKAAHPDAAILADAYHMYKGGSEAAMLRLLGRQAVHCFHMNDYPANPPRETIRDSDRIWPGDGIAPLKEILTYLAENHCQVYLSVELFNSEYWKLPALQCAQTGLEKMKKAVLGAGF